MSNSRNLADFGNSIEADGGLQTAELSGTTTFKSLSTTMLTVEDGAGLTIVNSPTWAMTCSTTDGELLIKAGGSNDIRFMTNSENRMYIKSDGTVEISANNALTLGTGNGELKLGHWNGGSHSDIDGLLPGSTFGNLIEGAPNGHVVLALRENDNADTFTIVSGGGDYQANNTYDTAITTFRANGQVGIGTTLPNQKLHVYENVLGVNIKLENNDGAYEIQKYSDDIYLNLVDTGDVIWRIGTALPERLRFLNSGGITFNGDTAAANALDDYEEGTFTPSFTTSGTLTVNSATYTKIGRQVTCRFYLTASTTCSGDITGLPFTPNGESGGVVGYQTHISGETIGILVQAANVWNLRIGQTQYGLSAGKQIRGMFTYFTNA